MASGNATEAQCECLSDYIHQRYSDREVEGIMGSRIGDELSRQQVEKDIREGSQFCAKPE